MKREPADAHPGREVKIGRGIRRKDRAERGTREEAIGIGKADPWLVAIERNQSVPCGNMFFSSEASQKG